MEYGIVSQPPLFIGQILRVKKGIPEKEYAKWLETGDHVRVIGIYPHNILVEKTKSVNGYHMRECFPRESWTLNLKAVS